MISLLLTLCVLQSCSDDPFPLGNERLCWDAADGAVTYEVAAEGVLCVAIIAPETCTDLIPSCRGDALTVRACNQVGCSEWSSPVEVWPWICIEGNREVPCFPGAPCRLPPTSGCTE